MTGIGRAAVALAITTGAALATSAPAFAGQAYRAPGFSSGSASCAGAAMNYQAHYGGESDSFPTITHGTVGPTMSGDATSLGGRVVGEFQTSLAQTSGPIWVCVP
jgi:hypothetical protein